MSAYLKFFQLESSPFDTQSQSKLVLGTKALRSAFAEIETGLDQGAPRICVSGKSGMGKTSLARALPKLLSGSSRVVVLLNPALPWPTLRMAIVKQLDLAGGALSRKTLEAASKGGKRIVLVIDRAEVITREALDHLDILLNYRSDDDRQLVHCVLLANLEADAEASGNETDRPLPWWLDSLNTLQLEFAPIPASGVSSYINKHLKRAGWSGGNLFSQAAAAEVHRLTGGVPRNVSELCEDVLAEAAKRGVREITPALVEEVSGEEGFEQDDAASVGTAPDRTAKQSGDRASRPIPPAQKMSRPAGPRFAGPVSARGADPAAAHHEPAPPFAGTGAPAGVSLLQRPPSAISFETFFDEHASAPAREAAGDATRVPHDQSALAPFPDSAGAQRRTGRMLGIAGVLLLALLGGYLALSSDRVGDAEVADSELAKERIAATEPVPAATETKKPPAETEPLASERSEPAQREAMRSPPPPGPEPRAEEENLPAGTSIARTATGADQPTTVPEAPPPEAAPPAVLAQPKGWVTSGSPAPSAALPAAPAPQPSAEHTAGSRPEASPAPSRPGLDDIRNAAPKLPTREAKALAAPAKTETTRPGPPSAKTPSSDPVPVPGATPAQPTPAPDAAVTPVPATPAPAGSTTPPVADSPASSAPSEAGSAD